MTPALIGLGASIGSRLRTLQLAAALLESWPGIRGVARSRVYLSAPMGAASHPFLNAAVRIETSLDAEAVLRACKEIEARLGRQLATRWGDRVVDLDLLLMGEKVIFESDLELPHPGLLRRSFALVPAKEVGGDLVHPGQGERLGSFPDPVPSGLRLWSCLRGGDLRVRMR